MPDTRPGHWAEYLRQQFSLPGAGIVIPTTTANYREVFLGSLNEGENRIVNYESCQSRRTPFNSFTLVPRNLE